MKIPQFEFQSVSKIYEKQSALSKISFEIQQGERIALIGGSGSGKSTALKVMTGLESPSEGTVMLEGQVASRTGTVRIPPHARGISMVFQDLGLWPNLTAVENVLLGLSALRKTKKEKLDVANEALKLCRISELEHRKPSQLSGGEQQRVALARALAVNPRSLFLDEPFSGLDLVTKSTLLREISEIVMKASMTLVLVTHDPLEASALCDRCIVLGEGKLEESGRFSELLDNPRSQILRVFRDQLRSVTRA